MLDGGVLPDGARHVSEAALLARREPKVALGKDTVYGMGLMVDRTGARRSCSTAAG